MDVVTRADSPHGDAGAILDRIIPADARPAPRLLVAPSHQVIDLPELINAVWDTALEEPHSVAAARAIVTDPARAARADEFERQLSWLVLLAARRQARARPAPAKGGAA